MTRLRRWWGGLSRRGKVITVALVIVVLAAMGAAGAEPKPDVAAIASPSPSQPVAVSSASPSPSPSTGAAPTGTPKPTPTLSPEAAIRLAVGAAFSGQSNEDKPHLRSVNVVAQQGGGWGVFVEFNADDNLTTGLTKGGVELRMKDGYKAIYTSGLNVRAASMAAWLNVVDKLGNESEAMVYKTLLDGKLGRKINWANADILHWTDIWETTILYPFLNE